MAEFDMWLLCLKAFTAEFDMELAQCSAWHGIVLGLTLAGFGMGLAQGLYIGRVIHGPGSRLTIAEFCVVLVNELKEFFRTN